MGELVDLLASLCTGSHENISNISHLWCTLQIYMELQMLHATTRKKSCLEEVDLKISDQLSQIFWGYNSTNAFNNTALTKENHVYGDTNISNYQY